MRRCPRCGEEKPLEAFNRDPQKPDGRNFICKVCRNRRAVERHRAEPELRRAAARRWAKANPGYIRQYHPERRWRRRGIVFNGEPLRRATFDRLVELQGGVCAICGREAPRGQNLHADHDWSTGELRGLLDPWCNAQLIPLIEEAMRTDGALLRQLSTSSLLGRAAAYVLHPPVQNLAEEVLASITA